jgi:predicted phosphodiesterase
MKGDRVEVLIDVGDGVRAFEIAATKDGRRVEIATVRGNVHVTEVTRTGQEVRTAQFMQSRVVAIVEHPASEETDRPKRPRARRAPQADSLDI